MVKIRLSHKAIAFAISVVFLSCDRNESLHEASFQVFALSPLIGAAGDTITISGDHFNFISPAVAFNSTPANLVNRTATELMVIVPEGATTGLVKVRYQGYSAAVPQEFTVVTKRPATRHTFEVHENGRVASMILSFSEFEKLNERSFDLEEYQSLYRDLYRKFEDDFDFIIQIAANNSIPRGQPAGYEGNISNHIDGIGIGELELTTGYGSAGRLQSLVGLPTLTGLQTGPLLHEIMHRWGNFVIEDVEYYDLSENKPIPMPTHWGFSGCGGMLGGFVQSTLYDSIDGNPNLYIFREEPINGYSDFELYLMGLLPPDSLEPFDVFTNVVSWTGRKLEANTRNTYNRARIEREFGVRKPDVSNSQKHFRALVLVMTPYPLTDAQWIRIDEQTVKFCATEDDGEPFINFWEATRGLATLSMDSLFSSIKPE
ncbi:MAG: IPT/TIG domain-containing protein [Imperialibacter sp.]|uniref:IPT/TIG domain-containing protein n=1 Tax=Imperialibacter sp. TaxID=2038411 RepID=UPI0030D71F56|tara:strand:+ start:93259 stop:94548 length:1290 start_codon:yes stop_codon:yes gene_type:complete